MSESKLKILKLSSNRQIGGKGTQRRKIKRSRKKITLEKQNSLNKKINEINKKILQLDKDNYIKLREFLNELIDDYMNDLQRNDINNNNTFNYKSIKSYGSGFIYKNFFYPVSNERILLKTDIYSFLNTNFKKNGKELFMKFIDSIDKILVKKEYDILLENEKYDEDRFIEALNFFEIDHTNKVHFREIRKKYREIMDSNLQDKEGNEVFNKNKANKYFGILSKQYDDYLKSN